ncbi:hypothetical protein PSE10C_16350 [Pseudomonas amygdali pv. eriobotryae]|uniref:Uncharacterized protein n=2 Tax=Pseudomonas syringae group genomosp. 2 TaxID=251698 RepID=A0A9P3AD11_PSEA0|nr:hypothetical protein PSE10A_20190 [Pseudomonas amygdali pv. eriobotryae]GFZ70893.1 hypothetical protein PSE10C_16350 [Pseudomonas amygdali pv. eriobotryae]
MQRAPMVYGTTVPLERTVPICVFLYLEGYILFSGTLQVASYKAAALAGREEMAASRPLKGRLERRCKLPERSRCAERLAEYLNGTLDVCLRGVAAKADTHAGQGLG